MIAEPLIETKTITTREKRTFFAKILLFGEYGIIRGSKALSIPFADHQGKLAFITSENLVSLKSHKELTAFAQYLMDEQQKGQLPFELDIAALEQDIEQGLYFDSTIPQGFGVGSSGALCAALYDAYAIEPIHRVNIPMPQIIKLKSIFAHMESYFHGKSSGMDPLICYLNVPILINTKDHIVSVEMPLGGEGKGGIFLLNSGVPGHTQPLVQWFLEQCAKQQFVTSFHEEFIVNNDECITSFLKGSTRELFGNLKHLSRFLFENLQPMIPEVFREAWKKGIDTGDYHLKLCGSGKGGYILGFTEDMAKARKQLKGHEVKEIFRF
ncbi:mevalonate kinase [soil metagenome]